MKEVIIKPFDLDKFMSPRVYNAFMGYIRAKLNSPKSHPIWIVAQDLGKIAKKY